MGHGEFGTWGPCTGSGAPTTCAAANSECGKTSDGCGGVLDCGKCSGDKICARRQDGTGNACGDAPCKPDTCASLGAACGTVSDGCGGVLDCGACPDGKSCGGAGVPNQCGCTPTTCADLGDNCGSVGDGCGGTLNCGKCPKGEHCGAGGVPNQCGCAPTTCAAVGAACGTVSDGCGGTLSCGTCPGGQQCGAGGVPNQCGCSGCCPSTTVAFVNCGAASAVMKPGAFNVQEVACASVTTASALQGYDTIVYVGPMSPAANADFPLAISTRLAAGAKVLFIPTGTCHGDGAGCGFGNNNWQTVYSDLYLEDNMEYPATIGAGTVTIPNPNAMTAAFSTSTYANYNLDHLLFNGAAAKTYLDYPGGTLSGTFGWCSDLVAAASGKSDPFHAFLLDSGSRKGLLVVTTLDYAHAGNTFDFSEPFLAAHLSLPWNQAGNSAACGLTCSPTTPWTPPTGVAKPVIYLYPPKDEDVYVRLDFAGQLTTTYPQYQAPIHGWKVHARHDGSLRNLTDGREYSYLYWEGQSAAFKPSLDEGFVVEGKDARQFLQTMLEKIGLTPREYNEMIVYWLPHMEGNAYNVVSFAGTSYTDIAKLTISPQPDSVLRVFMVFKKVAAPISVKPQEIKPFRRKGFTVVEWGGTELDSDESLLR